MDNSVWLSEIQWQGFWLSFCLHLWLAVEYATSVSVFHSLSVILSDVDIFVNQVCKTCLSGGCGKSSAIDEKGQIPAHIHVCLVIHFFTGSVQIRKKKRSLMTYFHRLFPSFGAINSSKQRKGSQYGEWVSNFSCSYCCIWWADGVS